MKSDSWQGQEVFLSSRNIHTQPLVQWVPGSISVKVKQLGHEADHTPASGANVVTGTMTPPHLICLHGVYNYNFTFIIVLLAEGFPRNCFACLFRMWISNVLNSVCPSNAWWPT